MKYFAVIIIIVYVFGCKQVENKNSTVTPNTTSIKTATPQESFRNETVISIPDLVGKTEKEILQKLGEPQEKTKLNATDKTGELSFDYTLPDGSFYFINFKNGKADYFHFESKQKYSDVFVLGKKVGIELNGVTAKESNSAQVTYSGTISGIAWHQIRVVATESGYKIITLQQTR